MAIDVNGLAKFRVEHECKFEGSTATLISKEDLDIAYHPINEDNINYQEFKLDDENPKDVYKVFHKYNPELKYFIEIDPSSGSGLDYTIINVLGKMNGCWVQSALWRCNNMNNNQTLDWIVKIAEDYNNPIIGVECNGIGEALVERLYYDIEYDNVLSTKRNNDTKKWELYYGGLIKGATLGIKTTNSLKLAAGDRLKELFNKHRLIIHDVETVKEFNTFIRNGTSYAAETGHTDDICMTYMLFAWIESNEMFYDLLNDEGSNQMLFEAPIAPINMNNYEDYMTIEDFLKN